MKQSPRLLLVPLFLMVLVHGLPASLLGLGVFPWTKRSRSPILTIVSIVQTRAKLTTATYILAVAINGDIVLVARRLLKMTYGR